MGAEGEGGAALHGEGVPSRTGLRCCEKRARPEPGVWSRPGPEPSPVPARPGPGAARLQPLLQLISCCRPCRSRPMAARSAPAAGSGPAPAAAECRARPGTDNTKPNLTSLSAGCGLGPAAGGPKRPRGGHGVRKGREWMGFLGGGAALPRGRRLRVAGKWARSSSGSAACVDPPPRRSRCLRKRCGLGVV